MRTISPLFQVCLQALILTLGACGKSDGRPSSEVANPTTEANRASTKPMEPQPPASQDSHEEGRVPEGACLSECNPPRAVLLSFGAPVSITPAGCVASGAKILTGDDGYLALIRANCDGLTQLFSERLGADGSAKSIPVLMSGSCLAAKGEVISFDADRAGTTGSALAAFTCRLPTSKFDLWYAVVDAAGSAGTPRVVSGGAGLAAAVNARVIWNGVSKNFGVLFGAVFQRLSENGAMLGGSTQVPGSENAVALAASGGVWSVLTGRSALNYYAVSMACSKVSAIGTLQCDRIDLRSTGFEDTVYAPVAGKWLVGLSAGGQMSVADFDPLTCLTTSPRRTGYLVTRQAIALQGVAELGAGYIGVLHSETSRTLELAFVEAKTGAVASTSAVMDGDSIVGAQVLYVAKRVVVVAVRSGDAVFVESEQGMD